MPEMYDFTIEPEVMDRATYAAYYRLRRVAILCEDEAIKESLYPDGKVMTEDEVAAALGVPSPPPPPEEKACC